jgi:hypothetical protein
MARKILPAMRKSALEQRVGGRQSRSRDCDDQYRNRRNREGTGARQSRTLFHRLSVRPGGFRERVHFMNDS